MLKATRSVMVVIAALPAQLAQASEETYQAGHRAGYAFGQAVAQFAPYVLIAFAALGAWLGWRAWKARRARKSKSPD